jgi:transposase
MPYQTKLISKELFNKALSELDSLGKYGKLSTRLQLIIVSKNLNISSAAKAFGFNRASVAKWIKRFDIDGISGLEDKPGKGRKTLSNPKIILELECLIK